MAEEEQKSFELTRQQLRLADAAVAIRAEEPGPEDTAFLTRYMVQATLPHRSPKGNPPEWFRVYDYTNATRLFGEAFRTKITKTGGRGAGGDGEPPDDGTPPARILEVVGFDVRVSDAGRYIITMVDGQAMPVTVEEYRGMLAKRLVAEAPTVEAFRETWVQPEQRRELMAHLPDGGRSAALMRALQEMADYDLFDVLAEVGYGAAPRTREARADAFAWKHDAWLKGLPSTTAATLKALSGQFRRGGTEELENPKVFQMPEVVRAGGLTALAALGNARQALQEAKRRIFAA